MHDSRSFLHEKYFAWRIFFEDALERDTFLTSEMAKDFGLIDKVIEKRPEEPGLKTVEPALKGVT